MSTEASVSNGVAVAAPEVAEQDGSHLIIQITQEVYDAVKNIAETAGARGMQDGFEFWACRLMSQHAKVQENLWRKADDTSMFVRAQKGNTQAQVAVLASLGIRNATPVQLKAFFAQGVK